MPVSTEEDDDEKDEDDDECLDKDDIAKDEVGGLEAGKVDDLFLAEAGNMDLLREYEGAPIKDVDEDKDTDPTEDL